MANANAAQTHKCAHERCVCQISTDEKYCSEYCKTAPEVDLHCKCPHPECRKNE